ncbi:MAG: SHOCT domain-containing protein [Nitrospinae bacterium]|nr:SHOCT domain-containing protein [Nitrospinota bacterium]
MKKRLAGLLSLITLTLLLTGCASRTIHTPIFEKGEEHVWLEQYSNNAASVGEYNHPAEIEVAKIKNILDSIITEELVFSNWSEGDKVFNDEESNRLAPQLSEALGRANNNQWVNFSIIVIRDGYLGKTNHLTDGIAFVKDSKLNIVFLNINYEIIIGNMGRPYDRKKERNYKDPRRLSSTDYFIRLLSDPSKGFSKPTSEHNNWLIFDMNKVMEARLQEKEETKMEKIKTQSLNVTERLKILQELKDEKIITEEEYQQKRKAIIEDL